MTSIVHPVVPKGVKIVYTSTSNFSQEDYSLFDSILGSATKPKVYLGVLCVQKRRNILR